MNKKRKEIIQAGMIGGVLTALVFAVVGYNAIVDNEDLLAGLNDKDVETWHTIAELNSYNFLLGENDPGGVASGWISTFCLDYAETPSTCLASNDTGAGYSGWGNVSGYVDTDDTDTDLKSDDPFYFVVRCRFNDTVKDGSDFMGNRCKCVLTVSGDETITAVAHIGDNTNNSGGGVVSQNGSDFIYINFYWDDNDDGYRITDDGSLDWSIVIKAKY